MFPSPKIKFGKNSTAGFAATSSSWPGLVVRCHRGVHVDLHRAIFGRPQTAEGAFRGDHAGESLQITRD